MPKWKKQEADFIQMQQEIPTARDEEAQTPAQSESYGDFIVRYARNTGGITDVARGTSFSVINENFGILYVPLSEVGTLEITNYSYDSIPKCLTYMDLEAINSSGISRLHNHPYLQLKGKGTAVAIIDSGECVIIMSS